MKKIKILLPEKLKNKAEKLVKEEIFVSFDQLVRYSVRNTVSEYKYDLLAKLAIEEEKQGKLTLLKTDKDIDNFFKSL